MLHLNSVDVDVDTLGPGPACVLWTQGCPLSCRGCMSPQTTRPRGGVYAEIAHVADWLQSRPERRLTLSGGEPSVHAAEICELLDLLGPAWTVTAYSGFDLAQLRTQGSAVASFLDRLDLLIAGPYVLEQHASLLWRGSANQVIHNLSGRVHVPADETAGVEVRLHADLVEAIGVPPEAGYSQRLSRALSSRGLRLLNTAAARTFPFPTLED